MLFFFLMYGINLIDMAATITIIIGGFFLHMKMLKRKEDRKERSWVWRTDFFCTNMMFVFILMKICVKIVNCISDN